MSGRSIGMIFGFAAGLRVGGKAENVDTDPSLTFVPAHINAAGKKIGHKCEIPVYCNAYRKNGDNKSSLFRLTVWGELARICALTLSPGRAVDALFELSSYEGKVYFNGQPVQMANGEVITTRKTSLNIMRIVFGEESQKLIALEVGSGKRPQGWDLENSPGWQQYKNALQQRAAMQYTGGNIFGFAKVLQPAGQILPPEVAPAAAAAAASIPTGTPVQQVTQAFTQPGMVPANPVYNAQAAPTAPVAQPGNVVVPTAVPQGNAAVATGGFGV